MSKRAIKDQGAEMSKKVFDAYDVQDEENDKNVKDASKTSTSKNGTGR